ncbi:MAG TPA: hypothetical protein VN721_00230 [Flavipsychrobacter sp.]|nr:hypothetical protein [Flavipsychrobacter sp.]
MPESGGKINHKIRQIADGLHNLVQEELYKLLLLLFTMFQIDINSLLKGSITKIIFIIQVYLSFLICTNNKRIVTSDLLNKKGLEVCLLTVLVYIFFYIVISAIVHLLLFRYSVYLYKKKVEKQNIEYKKQKFQQAIYKISAYTGIDLWQSILKMPLVYNYILSIIVIALQIAFIVANFWAWIIFLTLFIFTSLIYVTVFFLNKIGMLNQ